MTYTTRHTLLARVIEGEEIGWQEFHDIYKPIIIVRGKDRGLRESELDELIQRTLMSFFKGKDTFKYDRQKGKFRGYLKTIIDRRAFDILRERAKEARSVEDLAEQGIDFSSKDHELTERRWDKAWRERLLQDALAEISPHVSEQTLEAFKMTVLEQIPPESVAESLGMSTEAVYVAKHRTIKRLKTILKKLEDAS